MLADSPLSTTHTFSDLRTTYTEMAANVQVETVAESEAVSNDLASELFTALLNTSFIRSILQRQLNIPAEDLIVPSVRAEYMHSDLGVVVIASSMPPSPPPFLAVTPEVVTAVASLVSTAVATAVAASVTASVAMAVASSVAGATAGAAGGAAGAGAGGGASGGGAMPLIFGAQRFQATAGLAADKSELQTGVSEGMGWATGSFGWLSATEPSLDPDEEMSSNS